MKDLFYTNGKLNKNRLRESWVCRNIDKYLDIKKFQNDNNQNELKFSQVIYNYILNINVPNCILCNIHKQRFIGFDIGYNNFCSKKCASSFSKDKEILTRRNNTISKYGVSHTSMLESTKSKQESTNIKKYGYKSPTQNESISNKQQNTMLVRYGVKFSGQSDTLMNKSLTTRYEKYEKIIRSNYPNLDIINIPREGEIEIRCGVCKEIYLIRNSLLRLRYFRYKVETCIHCNPISSYKYTSQNEISDYLTSIGFEVVRGDRKLLEGKEIDIYIPSNNIAIEFNGLYWHSDLYKSKKYHLEKKEACEKLGINLIHIWEDNWIYKKDIVISRINNLLGINNTSIMGRKCVIKSVSPKISKLFLDENHIQGNINSSHRIGLFHDDRLVSLMTFGKIRRSLGNKSSESYELYRYCSLLNTNVIGGFSKLLNHFKLTIGSDIITYANRDWSVLGNVYEKNGFKFDSYTPINYWYFDKNLIRQHRFQYRKDVLIRNGFDKEKTESEIMSDRGYLKVYDCGSIKYRLVSN